MELEVRDLMELGVRGLLELADDDAEEHDVEGDDEEQVRGLLNYEFARMISSRG